MTRAAGLVRTIALVWIATLVVVRLSYPSEDADTGSGAKFALLAVAVGLAAIGARILGTPPSRATLADLAGAAFAGWLLVSWRHAEYRFPAEIMAWELTGVVAVWLSLRSIAPAVNPRFAAGLVVVLATGQSVLALHQYVRELPETLEKYRRRDPETMRSLAELGLEPTFALEARLAAGLPQGSYGHSNTLAGILGFALPLLVVLQWNLWRGRGDAATILVRIVAAILVLIVLAALAATRCRSSLAGLAVSGVLLASLETRFGDWLRRFRWPVLGLIGFAVVVLATTPVGGKVVAQAKQSLGYRLEWWQSTLPIVRSHPLWGIGFGNFRDFYLEHKLEYSSEEIADPHNFLMELAACTGLPGVILYSIALCLAVAELLRRRDDDGLPAENNSPGRWWFAIAAVAFVGSAYTLIAGLSGAMSEIAVLGVLLCCWAVSTVDRSADPASFRTWRRAVAASVVGMHVHMLAAGGVGHPGTVLLCWTMIGAASPSGRPHGMAGAAVCWLRLAVLGILLSAALLGGLTSLVRSLDRRDQELRGLRTLTGDTAGNRSMLRRLRAAAEAEPQDVAGWLRLAGAHRQAMNARGDRVQADYDAAVEAMKTALRLEPRRAATHHDLALTYWDGAAFGVDAEGLAKGVVELREACRLYPNSPVLRWEFSYALMLAGRDRTSADVAARISQFATLRSTTQVAESWAKSAREGLAAESLPEAGAESRRALELDEATPHLDKKLSDGQRRWAKAFSTQR